MKFAWAALCLAAAAPALAQQPSAPPAERPVSPQMAAAQAAFDALPDAARKQIQDDLIWASNFTATTSGQHGPRTHSAIVNFQRIARLPPSGILDEAQRRMLHDAANRARAANKLAMQADPRTGAAVPIAGALFVKRETLPTGTRWESADGQVILETGVGRGGADDLPAAFDRFVNIPNPNRRVTYKLLRPDFFVVSGDIGDRHFYVRYAVGPNNLRGYALSYPATRARDLERHVIAIANGFQAVPGAPAIATTPTPHNPPPGIATQPALQPVANPGMLQPGVILTGLVVAPSKIITAALASACTDLRVNGKPARLVRPGSATEPAEIEADTGSLKPFVSAIATPAANSDLVIVGFAAGQRPTLSVGTGTVASATTSGLRIATPLPREGGGSLAFDRSGNLVGMLAAPRQTPRLVAGFVPAASHPALTAGSLGVAGKPAAANVPISAGAITAAVSPSLVAVACGQAVTLPKD